MSRKSMINLTLLSLNIFSLTLFLVPFTYSLMLIILNLIIGRYQCTDIRGNMQIISLLTIVGMFIPGQLVGELLGVIALGLAMNIGYHIDF